MHVTGKRLHALTTGLGYVKTRSEPQVVLADLYCVARLLSATLAGDSLEAVPAVCTGEGSEHVMLAASASASPHSHATLEGYSQLRLLSTNQNSLMAADDPEVRTFRFTTRQYCAATPRPASV